ncbi:amino acid ABC transporter substrate-binding protein [Affinirhizobium pseudoryzae]|jgi:glutamate/aspartate transport system substrate-binding protein|uniref:amino acid ABC transporter substrate-binding protein n=1 Tax=Allorhizobium pseudoryzae TaxID=379684 RepID=UPI001F2D28AA|nr:amino acid ABC transporter substrate-binding protein [Allorhizobium pseudoryzae]
MKILFRTIMILLALLPGLAMASADAPAESAVPSTIERLRQTQVLRVGYGSAEPFSFTTSSGDIVGYSIDLCKAMAVEIRQMLKLPALDIQYVFRTPANRLQLLNDGSIDIECNASTNTPERRKAAAFSPPHFFTQTRFVSLAKNNIRTLEDLRGKSVSVVLGTVNIGEILQASRERKLGLVSVPVQEVREAFDLVSTGKASAFAMDDILLYNLIARSGRPEDYRVGDDPLSEPAAYGFMTRVNDTEFAGLVADALKQVYGSPQMREIYDKWFMRPIGDGHYTLNMPMSARLKGSLGLKD